MAVDCFLEGYFMFPATGWDSGFPRDQLLLIANAAWSQVGSQWELKSKKSWTYFCSFALLKSFSTRVPTPPKKCFVILTYTFKYTLSNSKYKSIMWLSVLTCLENCKSGRFDLSRSWDDRKRLLSYMQISVFGHIFLPKLKTEAAVPENLWQADLTQISEVVLDSHVSQSAWNK